MLQRTPENGGRWRFSSAGNSRTRGNVHTLEGLHLSGDAPFGLQDCGCPVVLQCTDSATVTMFFIAIPFAGKSISRTSPSIIHLPPPFLSKPAGRMFGPQGRRAARLAPSSPHMVLPMQFLDTSHPQFPGAKTGWGLSAPPSAFPYDSKECLWASRGRWASVD